MERFINKIILLFKEIMTKTKEFIISTTLILISTIIITINIQNEIIPIDWFSRILVFTCLFLTGSFFSETKFQTKTKKTISIIISGVIALLISSLTFFDLSKIISFYITIYVIDYIITLIILTIYENYKKTKIPFADYVTHIFNNITKKSLSYGILALGLLIILLIFNYLIVKIDIIIELEVLLAGFFYLPQLLYSLSETNDEISKFMKYLIKYILNILVITVYVIIYLYIIKLLILHSIPSNQIFRLLTALFIVAMPISLMINSFKENKLLDKISNKFPVIFIPFIFLQIYTLAVRIIDKGITEVRYIGLLIIIFEIIYILISIKNKKNLGKILIILIILINISLVCPLINMFTISTFSQYNILKTYEKQNLTEKELEKIDGAYKYLNAKIYGDKYINKLSKEYIELIKGWGDENIYFVDDTITISGSISKSDNKVNINGYSVLYNINVSDYSSDEYYYEKNITSNKFIIETNNQKINLSKIIEEYINNEKNFDDYFENNHEFILNDYQKIILNYLWLEYNKDKNTIKSYSIEGYLLEKTNTLENEVIATKTYSNYKCAILSNGTIYKWSISDEYNYNITTMDELSKFVVNNAIKESIKVNDDDLKAIKKYINEESISYGNDKQNNEEKISIWKSGIEIKELSSQELIKLINKYLN